MVAESGSQVVVSRKLLCFQLRHTESGAYIPILPSCSLPLSQLSLSLPLSNIRGRSEVLFFKRKEETEMAMPVMTSLSYLGAAFWSVY